MEERNSMVWGNVCKSPTEVVFSLASMLREWLQAKLSANTICEVSSNLVLRFQLWHSLPLGVYKLNTDASLFVEETTMGIGLVQRDSLGGFL